MAKGIVEYQREILPGGKTGEVYQPYKEAPPLTPIKIAAEETAAKVKLAGVVQDIGETMMKIQYHNELVIADKISNDSQIELAKSLNKTMTENRGTNAMRPDFISSSAAGYKESAREIVDNSGLSEPSKRVLSKVLDHQIYQATNNLLTFQRQETMSVQNSNIQADLEFRYAEVKAGANPDEQIRFHNAKIGMNQPGNTALMDLHAVRIRAASNVAQEAAKSGAAYAAVVSMFNLGTENSDIEGAVKYIRNPENLKDISRPQREALENYVLAQEAHDEARSNREATANYNKDLDTAGSLLLKGNMRGAVDVVTKSLYINDLDKVKIIADMKKPPPEGKSNPTIYLEGADIMYDSAIPMEDKKRWLLTNRSNLTDTDFKHLSLTGMSQERSNDKTAIKSGIDTLKASLITPGFSSQTQKERLDRAIKLYESSVIQNKDTLKTADQIKAYANTILKMSEFSNINPIQDMKADMAKIRGVGLTSTPKTTLKIGTTATNPQTGQRVVWDGSQWK